MPEQDIYLTLASTSEGQYKEKGSRFISIAEPFSDTGSVKELLDQIRKKYHDARHHCYAYALGPGGAEFRYNDDGEPSGTAGKPIYGQIQSFGLTNVLIVVVRYFGGVKLGTGGLIQAYRAAARDAIENGTIVEKTWNVRIRIRFGYERLNDLMKLIKDENAMVISQDFQMESTLVIEIRKSKLELMENKLSKLEKVDLTLI